MMGLLPAAADGLHASLPAAGRLISLHALGVVGALAITVACARMRRDRLQAWLTLATGARSASAGCPLSTAMSPRGSSR